MARHDAVLGARRRHPDDFLCAEIRGDKSQAAIHAGIDRPERKKSSLLRMRRLSAQPMPSTKTK